MLRRDYKLLNCRHNASKREIEAIIKITYLVFHPDKDGCNQWLMQNQFTVDTTTYDEGKAQVV